MLLKKMLKQVKVDKLYYLLSPIRRPHLGCGSLIGAGGENRTLIVCLEGRHISHYTTPAYFYYTSGRDDMEVEIAYFHTVFNLLQ